MKVYSGMEQVKIFDCLDFYLKFWDFPAIILT